MGAAKTKTVGGGAATPVANQWNQFLANGLKTGSFNPATGGASSATGAPTNSQAQQNGFGATINQMMGGKGPQFGNAPQFQGANFNPNQTNLDLSGFNFNPQNMNLDQLRQNGFNFGQNGFGGGGASAGMAGTQATGVPDFMQNQMQLGQVDMNDPVFAAMNQKLTQDNALALANTRERFGGNALNSGASLAESQFNAQANPAKMLAMQQLQNQMRGMNLQEASALDQAMQGRLGLSSQSQLGNRGISSQESIANAGNSTQASIANAQMGMQGQQLGMQGQGQILDYLLGSQRLGMDAAGQNAGNMFNQFNANNQGNQWNNENQFNNSQMQNNFNQQTFGQQSANTLGGFNAGSANQQNIMGQLFGAFGQSNSLGTPQAQTVEVQNPWMQGLQAVSGALQGAGSLYGAMKSPWGQQGGGGYGPSGNIYGQDGSGGGGFAGQRPPSFGSPPTGGINNPWGQGGSSWGNNGSRWNMMSPQTANAFGVGGNPAFNNTSNFGGQNSWMQNSMYPNYMAPDSAQLFNGVRGR